jgi:hypothetical protein
MRTEDTCDFAKSVKLHMRETIEKRLLSRTDSVVLKVSNFHLSTILIICN